MLGGIIADTLDYKLATFVSTMNAADDLEGLKVLRMVCYRYAVRACVGGAWP
jgi:hypothetical protein